MSGAGPEAGPSSSLLERIRARSVVDEHGCWIWQGYVDNAGYGSVLAGQKYRSAHRVSYEIHKGPIPPGLQVDHMCHNRDLACRGGSDCRHRRCVNPEHLDATTSRVNTLRSINTIAGINVRRAECKWGHPFDAQNTYIRTDGRRQCKTCMRTQPAAVRTCDLCAHDHRPRGACREIAYTKGGWAVLCDCLGSAA